MSSRKDKVLKLFTEWKNDRLAFAERQIPLTMEAGKDPAYCAMQSIAEYVLGPDGWVVSEVIAADPVLIETGGRNDA